MTAIKSKLINGIVANEVADQKIRNEMGIDYGVHIGYMVMETKVDKDTYYCCWSGGAVDIENNDVSMTEIGKAAFDTLVALPVGDNGHIFIQELRRSQTTSLKKKVISILKQIPSGSKVCFVGDMSGELDGHINKAFNLIGHKKLVV